MVACSVAVGRLMGGSRVVGCWVMGCGGLLQSQGANMLGLDPSLCPFPRGMMLRETSFLLFLRFHGFFPFNVIVSIGTKYFDDWHVVGRLGLDGG